MDSTEALRLDRQILYRGRIFTLVQDRVRLPGGRETRLDLIHHPGSVVLLVHPDPQHVILIRQYRHAVGRWIWELPAGSLKEGEDPVAAAQRECHEEIGLVPGRLEQLATFYPTPGYCTEAMIFFRLTELRAPDEPATKDEDEQIEPQTFTVEAARALVRAGDILDMKTALGLMLF
jgi:ADP-ribose pyrophosphatase